jgi:ParB-like chromosome segregation protein Spo0J
MTAPTDMANGAEPQAEAEHPVFALPVHPLAAAFPMMGEAELDDLAADIKKKGLHTPVTVDEEGRLLDGRNRLEGCRRAAVRPRVYVFGGDDAEAVRFIFSVNFHRRHLINEGKITAIKKVLELYPDFSDRAIARLVGASPATVGKVRADTEPLMSTDGHKPRTEASGRKARGVKPGTRTAPPRT